MLTPIPKVTNIYYRVSFACFDQDNEVFVTRFFVILKKRWLL